MRYHEICNKSLCAWHNRDFLIVWTGRVCVILYCHKTRTAHASKRGCMFLFSFFSSFFSFIDLAISWSARVTKSSFYNCDP